MKLVEKIETDRCIIKLLCQSDIEEGIDLYTNSDSRKYLGGVIAKEEAINKLNRWADTKKEFTSLGYTIVLD